MEATNGPATWIYFSTRHYQTSLFLGLKTFKPQATGQWFSFLSVCLGLDVFGGSQRATSPQPILEVTFDHSMGCARTFSKFSPCHFLFSFSAEPQHKLGKELGTNRFFLAHQVLVPSGCALLDPQLDQDKGRVRTRRIPWHGHRTIPHGHFSSDNGFLRRDLRFTQFFRQGQRYFHHFPSMTSFFNFFGGLLRLGQKIRVPSSSKISWWVYHHFPY